MLANDLLAGLMYGLSSQSFDRGFLAYVNQAEIQKLQPILDNLAQHYQDAIIYSVYNVDYKYEPTT